jgi:RNA polymerase sigma-70 factor (ECF subfamily)
VRITPDNVLRELHNRSPQALAFLLREYTPVISILVSRILAGVGAREDIEECVSDVFVAAWDRISAYDGTRGTVRTWLLVLAKYQALDRRRRLTRRVDVPPEGKPAPDDPVLEHILSRERQEALAALIEQLEPGIRAVMVCRYLLDIGIPEIASRLHLTRSQVDNRLSRGRQRLRDQWDATRTPEGGESIGHL